MATGFKKCRGILAPAALVEIDSQEKAGLVLKQRVDAGDERLSLGVATRQVPANDVVCDRKEPTVGTFSAFDARLLAEASNPLVGTCGRVPRPASRAALESPRVHVVAASEERPKKGDLHLRRRCLIDRPEDQVHEVAFVCSATRSRPVSPLQSLHMPQSDSFTESRTPHSPSHVMASATVRRPRSRVSRSDRSWSL